jgi:hypothetical protein
VFNANFSNISAISLRPALVVEEAGVPGENHRPWASNWLLLSGDKWWKMKNNYIYDSKLSFGSILWRGNNVPPQMQKHTHNTTDTLYSLLSNIHTIVSLSIFYCPKTSDNFIRYKFYNLEIRLLTIEKTRKHDTIICIVLMLGDHGGICIKYLQYF